MALSVKKGTWTGNNTSPQTISGVGFQPIAILVWSTGPGAAGSFQGDAILSIGLGTRRGAATQNMCTMGINIDNVGTTDNADGFDTTKLLWVPSSTTATDYTVALDSFNSDGFVVSYSSAANANGDIFHYLAFGGADLTDANVVSHAIPTTGTSTQKTGVGFQPDVIIAIAATPSTTSGSFSAHLKLSYGVAVSNTKFWLASICADDGANMTAQMDWQKVLRTDGLLHSFAVNGAQDSLLDLDTFDTDGFTLGILDAPTTSYTAMFLCLKGGRWDAGTRQKPAGTTDTLTGLSFQPKGVLFATNAATTAPNSIVDHQEFGIGAGTSTDGTQEGYAGIVGRDAVLPTVVDRLHATDRVLELMAGGPTPVEDNEADLTGLNSDGFTLTWLNSGTQDYYGWLAFTDNAGGTTFDRSLSDSASVTDDVVALLAFLRDASDSVTVTDEMIRTWIAERAQSDSIVVTDDLLRAWNTLRDMSDSVSTTDSVVSSLSLLRALSDEQSVTDSIARVLESLRNLSDSVDVEDLGILAVLSGAPVVETTATTNGTTATANAAVNLPSGIVSGDLLLVLHRSASNTTSHAVSGGGWTNLFNDDSDGSNDRISLWYRQADGTEGATITITQTSSKFASIAYRISGAENPSTQAPEFATLVTGTDAAPNPGSLSPTGGAKSYLWLWMGGWEGEQTSPPAGNPTDYSSPLGADSGTAGLTATNCRVAAAQRTLNAASENPGSWTISVSDDWTATVVAVHPAGAGGNVFSRLLSDSVALLDDILRIMDWFRTPSDSIIVTDELLRAWITDRILSDSIAVTADDILRFLSFFAFPSDSIAVTDATGTPSIDFLRFLADTQPVADELTHFFNIMQQMSDTVSVTDTVFVGLLFWRFLADSIGSTDELAPAIVQYLRQLSDDIPVVDSPLRIANLIRALSDSVAVGEPGILAGFLFQRFLSDAIAATDSPGPFQIIFGRLLADAIATSDDLHRVFLGTRPLSDDIVVTDVLHTLAAFSHTRALSDTLAVTDDLIMFLQILRSLSDSASVSDDVSRSAILYRQLSDAVGVGDSVLAGRLFFVILSDLINATDAVTAEQIVGQTFVLFERLTFLRRSMSGEEE